MRKPVMERHIAKTVIQILREQLVELETLKATGAAPKDTVRRLAFVRKLLVQFDATASRAFSSEVDTGSRQEKAMKQRPFSSEVDTGSRQENAMKQRAFSSEVDTGSRQENAIEQRSRPNFLILRNLKALEITMILD